MRPTEDQLLRLIAHARLSQRYHHRRIVHQVDAVLAERDREIQDLWREARAVSGGLSFGVFLARIVGASFRFKLTLRLIRAKHHLWMRYGPYIDPDVGRALD